MRTTTPAWKHGARAAARDGSGADGALRDAATRACTTGTVACQLGTLGGGNHFIELCLDTEEARLADAALGQSRNIGKVLAEHHIEIARRLKHNEALEDRDLAVFLAGTKEIDAYRRDLFWAQEYARSTAQVMLRLLTDVMREFWPRVTFAEPISCHHNYVAEEVHFGDELLVTRKGAIRAGRGEHGHHPGLDGDAVVHRARARQPESFESASHGAGRRMSRGQARKRFTVRDLTDQTAGVECRKDRGVIDEAPKAYKNIDAVMKQQQDLVEIVAELKQIVCVKG